ncbi:hypothetical protein F4678DRAFT_469863 [Xylaria arbuscula]|nr:hypothetical protein F4678DRAFT_469863 [Xylaria arbuscula]
MGESRSQSVSTHFKVPRKPLPANSAAIGASSVSVSSRGPTWMWEYLALVLSSISLTAMIAVLASIHETHLSHWKAPVSPNTLVSILAAVTRAPLGFAISSCIAQAKWNWFRKRPDSLLAFDRIDDASRGPWGSFWLVVWVKASHWVAIGAVVTIALLAFEPFLQAIISFNGRINPVSNVHEAQMNRSEFLDAGTYYQYEDGNFSWGRDTESNNNGHQLVGSIFSFQPDLGMVSAINNGFYNSLVALKQAPAFSCPTANCTWPPATTLAICSACHDVSSHVKRQTFIPNENGDLPNETWISTSLASLYLENSEGLAGLVAAFVSGTRQTDSHKTISFQNLSTMITTVQLLKAADGYVKGNLKWEDTPVTATECALYFCVRAYQSFVTQGEMNETTIASWSDRDYSSFGDNEPYTAPNDGDLHDVTGYDKWNNYSFYFESIDVVRPDLVLLIPSEDIQRLDLPANTVTRYNLTQNAVGSIVRWVNDVFFASNMRWPLTDSDVGNMPPVTQALYHSTNLTDIFNQAAISLSNWIRDVSNISEVGVAQEWVVFVQIEWPYIAVPLLASIIGILFCLLSIHDTRKLGLEAWKTDMVATLTHSVDAETRAQLRLANSRGDLATAAKTMTVRFEDVGNGFELRAKQA